MIRWFFVQQLLQICESSSSKLDAMSETLITIAYIRISLLFSLIPLIEPSTFGCTHSSPPLVKHVHNVYCGQKQKMKQKYRLFSQEEYEDLDSIYTEEKAQLNELEERFKTLEAEYTTIVEERKIAQEKREQQQRELAAMIKAATIVQSFWRSYKCRKMLKAKNKKKGKKGKKGKKK